MTDSAASRSTGAPGSKPDKKRGPFAAMMLFFRQVIAELKKVVTPTRSELVNYWLTVLGFVLVVMLLVSGLDFLFGNASIFVFTNPTEQ